jgi:hypothetical protein
MQILVVHALAPPSPVLAPLSGRLIGGNWKGGGVPESSAGVGVVPSSVAVASSPETLASSGLIALPPLLPLPPPDPEDVVPPLLLDCGLPFC